MGVAVAPLRQILVATDLSQRAGLALTRAAHLSRDHGASLTVLHVLPDEIDPDIARRARSSLVAHVTEHLESATVDVAIRRGKTTREISAEAVDRAADLVVVGAHGAHWLADAFLGSTAENLVRMSPAAVLLVKKPAKVAYRSVVLAVDTSEASASAARFATGLTPTANHIVVSVCVVVGENLLRMHGVGAEEIEELRMNCTEEVRERMTRLADALHTPPDQVIVTSGHPATRLAELCRSHAADLVVVGTGARSPMSYALLGSVAQQVMRQAAPDVLVVPEVST